MAQGNQERRWSDAATQAGYAMMMMMMMMIFNGTTADPVRRTV